MRGSEAEVGSDDVVPGRAGDWTAGAGVSRFGPRAVTRNRSASCRQQSARRCPPWVPSSVHRPSATAVCPKAPAGSVTALAGATGEPARADTCRSRRTAPLAHQNPIAAYCMQPQYTMSHPFNASRMCGATSYRHVLARDDSGALRPNGLYRCSGCSVVFADPQAWREGGPDLVRTDGVTPLTPVASSPLRQPELLNPVSDRTI